MPASWTSLAAVDPFVVLAEGRCFCRVDDLLALQALVRDLNRSARTDEEL